jgi:hypothetical protein
MEKLSANAGLVDRIRYYVDTHQYEKGKALAKLGDYLEECFSWELSFEDEESLQAAMRASCH